jgi:hypothetical protein
MTVEPGVEPQAISEPKTAIAASHPSRGSQRPAEGHANLGITSVYLQGLDSSEIVRAVHGRASPTISASDGLNIKR